MSQIVRPQVGVAALIFRRGRLLLGRRRKSPGTDTWQCPGGLLNKGESVFECARRETREETGIDIRNLHQGPYTNNRFENNNPHTVTLYVCAEFMNGEIQSLEPERAVDWQWFDIDHLPQPLFLPLVLLLEAHGDWLRSVAGKSV